jgi:hypothetical protein
MLRLLGFALALAGCGDDTTPPRDGGGMDGARDGGTAGEDAATDGGCPTPDRDGDGRRSIECGGDDCDDDDSNRFPGNAEVCDAADHDEDCDDSTFGFRDGDMDGVADASCCNMREGGLFCGTDCDDASPSASPTSVEACNGRDDDCDENTDEGVLETFVIDSDGDDFGSDAPDATTMEACTPPPGFADNRNDCNDASAMVNPAALERCDGMDNNCDGITDPGCSCMIGMTRPCGTDVGVCELGMQTCVDGTWSGCAGGVTGGAESCNGADDDCDGMTDEGTTVDCYPDPDMDDYAEMGAAATARCMCGSTETDRAPGALTTDCRPMDPAIHPGATELCDRLDQNCSIDGGTEPAEDRDNDMFTAVGFVGCTGGFPKTDCLDDNALVFPGQTMYFDTPATGGPEGFFDYDCSGAGDRQPPMTPTCGGSGLCSTDTCAGRGIFYMGAPACGEPITNLHWTCRCMAFTCGAATRMGNVPCR